MDSGFNSSWETNNENVSLVACTAERVSNSRCYLNGWPELALSLDDPALKADRLVLRQQADIQPESIQVVTRSKAPAGNLEFYETTLHAQPHGGITRVKLTVTMQVHVKVPKVFVGRADEKVQQATDKAIDEQAHSLTDFVNEYAGKRLIVPDLNR